MLHFSIVLMTDQNPNFDRVDVIEWINSCGHTTDFLPTVGKLDLLKVYLGKIEFLSVTDARLKACLKGERVTLASGLKLALVYKQISHFTSFADVFRHA